MFTFSASFFNAARLGMLHNTYLVINYIYFFVFVVEIFMSGNVFYIAYNFSKLGRSIMVKYIKIFCFVR